MDGRQLKIWIYSYIHIFIYVNCMFNSTIIVLVFFCRFAIDLKYNIIVVIYHWTLICMIFMYILILKYKNKQTKWYGDQISAAFNCSIVDACMIRVVCFILRRLKGECFPYSVLNLSTHTKMISPGSYRFRLIALTH